MMMPPFPALFATFAIFATFGNFGKLGKFATFTLVPEHRQPHSRLRLHLITHDQSPSPCGKARYPGGGGWSECFRGVRVQAHYR